MIDNVQNNQIAPTTGRSILPHPDPASKIAADGPEGPPAGEVVPMGTHATLQVTFADLINQALQTSETDTEVVRKARELLQSGQLTSLENIRSAAAEIASYGI